MPVDEIQRQTEDQRSARDTSSTSMTHTV